MENYIQSTKYSVIQRQQFGYTELTEEDWTIYVVIDGSFRCELNGIEDILEKGDLYFIPPFVPFRRSVIQYLKVHFFRFELREGSEMPFPLPVGKVQLKDEARLQSSLQMLKELSGLPLSEQNDFIEHLLCDILYQCRYESTFIKKSEFDPLVTRVIDYFEQNYTQKINMREVAEQFGISPSGLILKFRRSTGRLPMRYLINIRIKYAKKLLANTMLSLAEIADRTGFENCYYFSTAFKKEVGIAPSEYRKTYTI